MIALTVLAASVSALSIWMIILVPSVWIILIFILPSLYLPLFVSFIRASKVRLGSDYVETVSFLGKKKIYLWDVKKFGIFFRGRSFGTKLISQKNIDESSDDELLGHVIYLTTNHEFDLDSFRPMKHLRFHYRKDLYFRIKKMIEQTEQTPSTQQSI
ncbi:hypothetical protein SAMN05660236_4770 [Ohtaekwangia koreensis]|uniref:Uncharacterized protein n=1 Tax=Ohtaekwangia koreensis TaxID=688867 RepID=A0A1T5M834_9BACT|nr:hypothetical protein SAMN05660236_4770 [Ohtaekwangia koreensis]